MIYQLKNPQKVKELLRNSIICHINEGIEFNHLETLCKAHRIDFSKKLINYTLDTYLKELWLGGDKFKARYVSLWDTSWKIINGKSFY